MLTRWFFSQLKPNFRQNYRWRFSNQCLFRVFCICELYSTAQNCVWSVGTDTCYAEAANKCIFVWITSIKILDLFQNDFLDFSYHGLNQQISSCATLFNDKAPGKSPCIANLMDRYSQKLELVWFLLKKAAFHKNKWLHFIHQVISRLF